MPTRSNRRAFLEHLAMGGAAWTVGRSAPGGSLPKEAWPIQMESTFFRVGFDVASGRLGVQRRDNGDWLVVGATARACTSLGDRSITETRYERSIVRVGPGSLLGEGQQLEVRCRDQQGELDFDLRLSLPQRWPALVLEVTLYNATANPVVVSRVEPIRAVPEEGGVLRWPRATKVLTNGPMYYDPGTVAEFAAAGAPWRRSWWNIGVFAGYEQEGLVCGYLRNQGSLGQLTARRGPDHTLGLTAESVLADGFQLPAGQAVRTEPFVINLASDPYTALEDFAAAMGSLQAARHSSPISGWCSWFYTYEHITEEEVLRNAEFAARVLRPLGLEYLQVDEGFQRWHGEWEGNDRFPHGMKWLADRIRALGLRPGIWLAPYVIAEPTEVFRRHPDWLLRHPDGRLKRVGPWPSEDSDWARGEQPRRYGLDITHPAAAAWLEGLFDRVANRWGYEMFKIDFVDWSLLSAHQYHDPTVTRAAAYRRGFEIIRRAIGADRHLQDCGPGPVTVGLLDSMRIELDQNYGYRENAWKQYFLSPTSSAAAAAKRYYFHGRTWVNDADHVCLNLLHLTQAQAAATLIGLTGGNVLSGDRLSDLDPSRLEILKKILPASGEAARPVDLFDTDIHRVFAVKIRRPFAEWTVLGVFNPDETRVMDYELPLQRLWLDPSRIYLAYDFWKEGLAGEVQQRLHVRVPPASVTLLSLHEKRDTPQVLSTDRHILQGALELEEVKWEASTRTMTGVSVGPQDSAHQVIVHLPEAQPWKQGGPFLFHDADHYTLKLIDAHLLRVRVRFGRNTRVAWRIPLDEFLQGVASPG